MSETVRTPSELQGSFRVAFVMAQTIEKLAEAAIELERQANHDDLTGALNPRGLNKYLETAKSPKALIYIDPSNFKAVNDMYGHSAGDALIKKTYEMFVESTRPSDIIARIGGDEFVAILNGDGQEPFQNTAVTENKRVNQVHTDYIDPVKVRISDRVQEFLVKRPDLKAVNFDISVGGVEWSGGMDVIDLIKQAERKMMEHKDEQHRSGQHRPLTS